ncbi:MAG: DUF1223 domain-containing protein [Fulvimarina manganoxydans]|uniref:DUF1223 domain-containing protein n=1 Tax=Fulvimarina manganoxydans TaxID=937218 RepID=UPI002352C3D9|nr:DUF1223 domain-containing protein [Fulvimarina manganoxydans]MCK5934122.1 DUF1223 domain-containing protein [Fulvimarina manganoxydans]
MQISIPTTNLLSPAAVRGARAPQWRAGLDEPEPSPPPQTPRGMGRARMMVASALSLILATIVCLLTLAGRSEASDEIAGAPISHVVELFTSQGCRSCPTADKVLADLDADPSLLVLAYHVDYWDYIGWQDLYGSTDNTNRQRAYQQSFSLPSLYTPQLVVNGRAQLVATPEQPVAETVAQVPSLATEQKAWVKLERVGEQVKIRAGLSDPMAAGPMPVLILVTFDEESETVITRGENAGSTLRQTHPVRDWRILGMWSGEPLKIELPLATLVEDARGANGCAALIQAMSPDGSPGPILAAARLALPDH